jgi:superfamily II DNA or RNA helicase
VLFLADRTVVPRAVDAERRAIEQLRELGLKGPLLTLGARATRTSAGDVVIPEQALLATVRALLSSGWKVFAAGKRYRQGSTINVVVESGIDWFEVGGEADFAGVHVPLPRLLRELKRGRSYVELGDGEIGLIPEEWMARWGLFASVLPDNAEVLRFSNRQLGLMEALLRAEPDESGSESLKALRSKLDSFHAIVPAPPPATFKGELRPYQSLGLGWLHAMRQLGFGVCLADDMGLGKTVQLLAHLAGVHGPRPVRASRNSRKARARTVPSLVVVPRSLVGNGMDEARRFAPELRLHVHWGAERGAPSEWTDADVVITTYGTLRADIDAVSRVPLETVVLDEAQAIKNESSATAKCVKLLRARHRIALTGTPVENHAGELWSLFDFMNPGMLAELPGLKKGVFGSTKPSAVSLDLVQRVIRPFVLRRKKSEVAKDLPERVEQTLFVELEKDERAEYEELARHYRDVVGRKLAELGADRATPHVLEALLRLRQAACHPGLVDTARVGEPSAKITALLEQLEELREEGHKALVFSQFTSLLRIVRRELESRNIRHEYLDGKTRDRAARVESFQNNPDTAVFLISLKAGGVGLNLTAADYVFILDPWWNPRRRGTSHRPRTPHRPDPFSDRLPLAHTRHDRRTSCGATGDEARSRVRPHGRDRHPS